MFFSINNFRKAKRTKQIMTILTKYGLWYLFDHSNAINFAKRKSNLQHKLTIPERLRLSLEELGPTFIKFGQILSTRRDLLPQEYIIELEKLQDNAQIIETSKVVEIIEHELGKPINKLFKDFTSIPVGSASLSQVHKAVLFNNDVVAIKVQRPNIKEIIKLDMEILEDLASIFEKHNVNAKSYHTKIIIEEFKKAINKELDFYNEAQNFDKFRLNFKDITYFKVPRIYWEMTTHRLITMEFIEGININKITQKKYNNAFESKKVAQRGSQIILKQVLEDGFFHADPHPANLLVQAPATIVMLDVGMVGYLDEDTIRYGTDFLHAIITKDVNKCIKSLENLEIINNNENRYALKKDLRLIIDKFVGVPLKNIEIGTVCLDILSMMTKHNLVLPGDLVLMFKALLVVETIGLELDPDLDMVLIAKPYIENILKKRFSSKNILKRSKILIQDSIDLFEHFPQELAYILSSIRKGDLKISIKHEEFDKYSQRIVSSSNQISLSLIISALIIGSSIVIIFFIFPAFSRKRSDLFNEITIGIFLI